MTRESERKIQVKVIPRSSLDQVMGMQGEVLRVRLRAPPVDGAANEALVKLLASHFAVKKSQIRIIAGKSSRAKLVQIG